MNMRLVLLLSLIVSAIAVSFVRGSAADPTPGTRLVTVTVKVRDEMGKGVPDAVVVMFGMRRFSKTSDLLGGATKASGDISIQTVCGAHYGDRAYVALRHHILHHPQELEDWFRVHGLRETYPVAFQEGVNSYELTIKFHPTVTASGEVAAPDLSQPRDVLLSCSLARTGVTADSHFDLRGVRQGEGGTLYVFNRMNGILTRKTLEPESTLADFVAEGITEQGADDTGRLRAVLRGLVPEVPSDSGTRVVLVSTTGSRLYQFRVSRTGQVQAWNRSDDEVRLAPGEYFLFPGSITSVLADKLVRLVLAGKAAEISAAMIPKVTVTTELSNPIEVDTDFVWERLEHFKE